MLHQVNLKKLILFSIFFTILISLNQEIIALPYAGHDDGLFVSLSQSIYSGNWLGQYSSLTLVKGIGYPLFLMINYILGTPLLLLERLLYVFSGLVFTKSLSLYVRSKRILVLISLIYLFNPVSFDILRVTREGIYPALTVLVFSMVIYLTFSLCSIKVHKLTALHIFLGSLVVSFFFLTREETIWIFPSISIIFFSIVLSYGFSQLQKPVNFTKLTFLNCTVSFIKIRYKYLLLILITTLSFSFLVSFINLNYYGRFLTNEIKDESFEKSYRSVLRLQTDLNLQASYLLPITSKSLTKAYSISPTFSELKEIFSGESLNRWYQAACDSYPQVCNIENLPAAGWFMWAFRDAVDRAGYYKDANSSKIFYDSVYTEISSYCLSHSSECLSSKSVLPPPLYVILPRNIPSIVQSLFKSWETLLRPYSSSRHMNSDDNFLNGVDEFENYTRNIARPSASYVARGWVIVKDPEQDFFIESLSCPNLRVAYLESPDLVKAFQNSKLIKSRFEVNSRFYKCLDTIQFKDLEGNILLENLSFFDIDQSSPSSENRVHVHLDYVGLNSSNFFSFKKNLIESLVECVFWIYRNIIFWVLLSSIFAFSINCCLFLFCRTKISSLTWINLSLIIAIMIRCLMLSIIDVTSFPAINTYYLSPCYPLLYVFSVLSLHDFLNYIFRSFLTEDKLVVIQSNGFEHES